MARFTEPRQRGETYKNFNPNKYGRDYFGKGEFVLIHTKNEMKLKTPVFFLTTEEIKAPDAMLNFSPKASADNGSGATSWSNTHGSGTSAMPNAPGIVEGRNRGDNSSRGSYSGNYIFAKTWSEYIIGRRNNLNINTSALNLSHVSQSDLRADGSVNLANPKQFGLKAFTGTALALGNITLVPQGNNMYLIQKDIYDFDIKFEQGWSFRNIATGVAGFVHGGVFNNIEGIYPPFLIRYNPGYSITFTGSIYLKPKK